MPVYIGDVLESAGGPVLDLSTRQVKGIGFFSDTDQRDDLPEDFKSKGYISVIGSKAEIYRSTPDSNQWYFNSGWRSFLVDRGFAFNLPYFANGDRDVQNEQGFLLNPDGAVSLLAGEVFHVKGIDGGNWQSFAIPRSDKYKGAITDGSYLVVEDVAINGAAQYGPVGDQTIGQSIGDIHDKIEEGKIVAFHPSRTSVSRHISLTDSNIQDYTPYDSVAEALLSNDTAKILLGFDNSTNQVPQDFSLTFSNFISVLTTGIAEDLVTSGYGDYASYGGVEGTTYSAGDINQDGLVSVADLLILLGGFGSTPDPTFDPAIVSFGEVYGDIANFQAGALNPFSEDLFLFDSETNSRTFMYKDWGTYGENPTVTQGGPTVHIVNSNNSLTDLDSISSPPGDMVIFSETPSVDFYINAFGGTQANQARIEIRENAGETLTSDFGWRNIIQLTDQQQNANMQFKIVARVRRFSSAESLPDITQNVIDDREILLHNLGPVDYPVFYNLTTGEAALLGESSISISDLYQNQVGSLIFENTQDSEGNTLNVKAVGVQVGFRFTNTFLGSNMSFPNVNISNFDLICYPPVG